MTDESLSKYVFAEFGGNTEVSFSLHDPISKDLLYSELYVNGFLGKKRILKSRKYH